ncbi:MAG: hypothetical protein ISS70_16945 [Phycisphaerae bacterium]|nr:hypothetical protein [Phycisphaerae bacterium]
MSKKTRYVIHTIGVLFLVVGFVGFLAGPLSHESDSFREVLGSFELPLGDLQGIAVVVGWATCLPMLNEKELLAANEPHGQENLPILRSSERWAIIGCVTENHMTDYQRAKFCGGYLFLYGDERS